MLKSFFNSFMRACAMNELLRCVLLSIEAFCLRMLISGSFNLKNRWYAPAPRVRRDRNETMAIFARNPLRITVVFLLFALYDLGESVEKSKFGCLLCKRKSR